MCKVASSRPSWVEGLAAGKLHKSLRMLYTIYLSSCSTTGATRERNPARYDQPPVRDGDVAQNCTLVVLPCE